MTGWSLPNRRVRAGLAALVAIGLFAVAGCSSGSNKATADSTGPIKVFTVGNFSGPVGLPEIKNAIQAGIDDINANGGINGRQVSLTACDDQLDANRAVQCAQSAISGGAVADIGDSSAFLTQYEPLLLKANIPIISTISGAQVSYTSTNSFPFSPVVSGAFTAMPQLLASAGATKISMITQSGLGDAGAALNGEFENGVKIAGGSVGKIVAVPETTADYGPAVNSALSGGADGVAAWQGGLSQANIVKAIRQQYPSIPIAVATFALTPAVISAVGSAGNGVHVVGLTAPLTSDVPAVKMYLSDMAKYQSSSAKTDQALVGWLGAWTFGRVAKQLPSVTADALLQKMGTLSNFDMGGAIPPITTTKNCTTCGDDVRLFNPNVTFLTLNDGKLTEDKAGQFVDVFTGKTVTAAS